MEQDQRKNVNSIESRANHQLQEDSSHDMNNKCGNLHSMLSSYEQSQKNHLVQPQTIGYQNQQQEYPQEQYHNPNHNQNQNKSANQNHNEQELQEEEEQPQQQEITMGLDGNHFDHHVDPSDMSIQLDTIYRERSSTMGSFRDRGLTFGSVSEFDLGLGFEDGPSNAGGEIVDGAELDHGNDEERVIEFAQDVSVQKVRDDSLLVPGSQKGRHLNIVSANSSSNASGINGFKAVPQQQQQRQNEGDGTNVQGDNSHHFFSGMFGTNENDVSRGTGVLGHTPPSVIATSYEGNHFGKRMRAGVSPLKKILCLHTCIYEVINN
jgi:hypothetical protein